MRNIYTVIPHSDFFILIDKVIHISNNYIIGEKHVNINDWFIKNHFTKFPIMPGVFQLEAIAQLASFFF
jgi:UDP-3-O-[3-hydroxymyristoyl] N-acetylglucosamine deacetylase/3-hydroxyacyl-[acyl-carrier-protein] dehydratase